jgi:hypothetical protein
MRNRKTGGAPIIVVATAPPEEKERWSHASNPSKANTPTRAYLSQILNVEEAQFSESRPMARLPLVQDPVVDGFDVEAPVTARVKGRNLSVLQQP